MVGHLQNIFIEHDFWHKRKMYNFDTYSVFLAIATNIPQRLKIDFVVQGHIYSCDARTMILRQKYSFQYHKLFQKSFKYADLAFKKHFILLSMLKTVVLFHSSVETLILFFRILR